MPDAPAAAVNTSFPAAISTALTICPALTATPFSANTPEAGKVAIFTDCADHGRAGDVAVLVADVSVARNLLGWTPQRPSVDQIVADALAVIKGSST